MPNAILDTLTIDGVAMDNNVTQRTSASRSTPLNLTANTWATMTTLTIPKKGLYAIEAKATFPAVSTTGAINRGVRIIRLSSDLCSILSGDISNAEGYRRMNTVVELDANDVLTCQAISSRAGTATGSIFAQLIYPLGGVVRHLKSVAISTFYRPRFYGKAVA